MASVAYTQNNDRATKFLHLWLKDLVKFSLSAPIKHYTQSFTLFYRRNNQYKKYNSP